MNPSEQLVEALQAMNKLKSEEFKAVVAWLRGNGRAALRAQGATDKQIGPLRLDIDRMGDAPLG